MPWTPKAVPRYNKRRTKLPPEVRRVLNDEQAKVLQDPYEGERKRGALKYIWVEKFQTQNDQYLLAYEIVENGAGRHFLRRRTARSVLSSA